MQPINNFTKSCLAVAITQALIFSTNAAEIEVNTFSDVSDKDDVCTLREAIESAQNDAPANSGCRSGGGIRDEIVFNGSVFAAGGSILLNSSLPMITTTISISAPDDLVIDGNKKGTVFTVRDGQLALKNTIVTGGSATLGGGIVATDNSTLSLNACKIQGNLADNNAAGIYVNASSLSILGSTISDNSASVTSDDFMDFGGGVSAVNTSAVSIESSTISSNLGHNGAGIFLRESSLSLSDTEVLNNTATSRGGGIRVISFNDSRPDLNLLSANVSGNHASRGGGIFTSGEIAFSLRNSDVSDNYSDIVGGGIYITYNTDAEISNTNISHNESSLGAGITIVDVGFKMIGSTVSSNSASSAGGGLSAKSSATLTNSYIVNSTFSNNSVGDLNNPNGRGGAIYMSGDTSMRILNSTLSGNSSGDSGGGIYANPRFADLSLTMNNAIVSGNNALIGNEVYISEPNFGVNLGNNLFGNSSISSTRAFNNFIPSANDIVASSNGNIPTALADILLPLSDNGGLTQTHLLVPDGPAVNAGDNSTCMLDLVSNQDQRGETRLVRNVCDIGAVELREDELPEQTNDSNIFVVPLADGGAVIFEL